MSPEEDRDTTIGNMHKNRDTFTLEVPGGYTINLWLCCGGWRRDADPHWK